MTGCDLCDVGPDDDCAADCPSRTRRPPSLADPLDLERLYEIAADLTFAGLEADAEQVRNAAREITRLRTENEAWRSLDRTRLDMLRQSAAELRRLEQLIDPALPDL